MGERFAGSICQGQSQTVGNKGSALRFCTVALAVSFLSMCAKSQYSHNYLHIHTNIYIYIFVLCVYPQYISVEQLLNPQLARSYHLFVSEVEDMARELRVQGYSSQRLAHVAAFGPVNLTLEAAHDEGELSRDWIFDARYVHR